MIDQFHDRAYQLGRAALNRDLAAAGHRIARTIGESLSALHRIEWSAPWPQSGRSTECR